MTKMARKKGFKKCHYCSTKVVPEWRFCPVCFSGDLDFVDRYEERFSVEHGSVDVDMAIDLGQGTFLDFAYVPAHQSARFKLKPFFISKYPVTQRQWKAVFDRILDTDFDVEQTLEIAEFFYRHALIIMEREEFEQIRDPELESLFEQRRIRGRRKAISPVLSDQLDLILERCDDLKDEKSFIENYFLRQRKLTKSFIEKYFSGHRELMKQLDLFNKFDLLRAPSRFNFSDEHPVERVNWRDCIFFLNILNWLFRNKLNSRRLNYGFLRLPFLDEWKYACSGDALQGSSDINDDYCWYANNSSGATHSVGEKLPNDLGLYDMNGNVAEWCIDLDRTQKLYYSPITTDDVGEWRSDMRSGRRVLAGGSFHHPASKCSAEYFDSFAPHVKISTIGFRILMEIAFKKETANVK